VAVRIKDNIHAAIRSRSNDGAHNPALTVKLGLDFVAFCKGDVTVAHINDSARVLGRVRQFLSLFKFVLCLRRE